MPPRCREIFFFSADGLSRLLLLALALDWSYYPLLYISAWSIATANVSLSSIIAFAGGLTAFFCQLTKLQCHHDCIFIMMAEKERYLRLSIAPMGNCRMRQYFPKGVRGLPECQGERVCVSFWQRHIVGCQTPSSHFF